MRSLLVVCCFVFVVSVVSAKYDPTKCEVCTGFLTKFRKHLDDNSVGADHLKIEKALKTVCKKAKSKEERFCWYVGASETSATGMIHTVSKPLSFHKPVEKICGELYKKDAQICDLKYDVQIDLKTVNIKKLKVKELKKILEDHGDSCRGCTEKSEFVKKVEKIRDEVVNKSEL